MTASKIGRIFSVITVILALLLGVVVVGCAGHAIGNNNASISTYLGYVLIPAIITTCVGIAALVINLVCKITNAPKYKTHRETLNDFLNNKALSRIPTDARRAVRYHLRKRNLTDLIGAQIASLFFVFAFDCALFFVRYGYNDVAADMKKALAWMIPLAIGGIFVYLIRGFNSEEYARKCVEIIKNSLAHQPVNLFYDWRLNGLEYLKLSKFEAFMYDVRCFFAAIPGWIVGLFVKLWKLIKELGVKIKDEAVDIFTTFTKGNWAVKLSFLIFGFGNIYYGQVMRGILFFLFEALFIFYMFIPLGPNQIGTGCYWIEKANFFGGNTTVGTVQGTFAESIIKYPMPNGTTIEIVTKDWVPGDDSVKVLLYALLSIVFIIGFIVTWRMQVKQCRICMDITATGKKIKSGKDDLKSLLDDQFHKTLLTPSLAGILIFTILPTIYMVLIAFTNYDANHDGYSNLFSWVGLQNFNELSNVGHGGLGAAFGEILGWTLMWAFFATFSNYFLGMMVAIMINKKGIKFKKFWRTVLVMTIAIPQFVSLMYVSKLFARTGIIGDLLLRWGWIPDAMIAANERGLWENPVTAKILLIVINIWIGIPYIMLMATGILMNIPADLYESARVDGASGAQQFTKITLPYMLFVTGPYLLTSFVGNLNNFNVIYLLSGGGPNNLDIGTAGGVTVGHTDLLITWLYKMTLNSTQSQYYMASVIGILMFLVCAVLSLIVYNVIPSTKNEEDFG